MAEYILKDALVAEIESLLDKGKYHEEYDCAYRDGNNGALYALKGKVNTLEVKEVDIDKLCEFRENIGFAYPEGVSEYQKHLACYRQGIEDVLKAQKGEEV